MSVIYDAGVLIAADRGDPRTRARHAAMLKNRTRPIVPAPVVWQVWRNGPRQARLGWLLRGCTIEPVDGAIARAAGELTGRARTVDGVDAVVALSAARHLRTIITSDVDDLRHLVDYLDRSVAITILPV